jgi:hypothetical protein
LVGQWTRRLLLSAWLNTVSVRGGCTFMRASVFCVTTTLYHSSLDGPKFARRFFALFFTAQVGGGFVLACSRGSKTLS